MRTGVIKRTALPSPVLLLIGIVYFALMVAIYSGRVGTRRETRPQETSEPSDPSVFQWKRPSSDYQMPANSTEDTETPELVRLEGWPTEFPADLDTYRAGVLNSTLLSGAAKHRMEIAPWVWHHRGLADVLEQKSLDPNTSIDALEEMAQRGIVPYRGTRARAAFVVLIRNRELNDFLRTMRQLEDRFNRRYHYPYVFLNDEPFTTEFMHMVAQSTVSNVTFGLVPTDHWSMPEWIDPQKALEAREQMRDVIYGTSLSYRHMCRFNSGFFYHHPLLADVEFYWRVEPNVDFYCDIPYDPFVFMRDNNKLYSFVIALRELEATIPTLWDHTLEFMRAENISSDLMPFFVSRSGEYNLCHFWSNFEIASLAWLRSAEYQRYFDYLDRLGGFFMERWGDAPVHSLAAGMFLKREQVHFFNDIGYRHEEFTHCPSSLAACQCPKNVETFDDSRGSCLPRWLGYEPFVWTPNDTVEAQRLAREERLRASKQPMLVNERRRWYDFFGRF